MTPRVRPSSHNEVAADSGHLRGRRHRNNEIKFFTIPEVAECLNVSTRTVRRWIERGELVAHHFGATLRIAETDLRAFLAQHRDT
jgi:excisionase family DNA binding protein